MRVGCHSAKWEKSLRGEKGGMFGIKHEKLKGFSPKKRGLVLTTFVRMTIILLFMGRMYSGGIVRRDIRNKIEQPGRQPGGAQRDSLTAASFRT